MFSHSEIVRGTVLRTVLRTVLQSTGSLSGSSMVGIVGRVFAGGKGSPFKRVGVRAFANPSSSLANFVAFCGILWHFVASCGVLWRLVAFCGILCFFLCRLIAFCGFQWQTTSAPWLEGAAECLSLSRCAKLFGLSVLRRRTRLVVFRSGWGACAARAWVPPSTKFALSATLSCRPDLLALQGFLDPADVQRVSKIEVLDEVEEWELIMVSDS